MKHGKVVVYASRQLRPYKENYLIHDLELIVVIYALKLWGHCLNEAKFKIFIDHKSLKYVSF